MPRSRLVYVKVDAFDPLMAARIANMVANVFIEQNLSNQLFISKDVLNALQIERSGNQSRAIYESLPAVVNNVLIQQLKQEAAKLQAQLAEASGHYTTKHPQVVALTANLQALQGQIKEETDKVIQSLKIDLSGQLVGNNIRLIDAAVPVYKWFPSNEFYFAAPLAQNLRYPGGTARAAAWAFGFRAVSNGEGVGKTGALQIQHLTVNNKTAGVNGSFYLLDLLAGAEYISPAAQNQPMRFTASALANLGLADTTLYMAPMLTAGLLYQTNPAEQIPNGLSLTLYCRLTDIHLDNAAGKPAALRPSAGLRLGYIFPGFWIQK